MGQIWRRFYKGSGGTGGLPGGGPGEAPEGGGPGPGGSEGGMMGDMSQGRQNLYTWDYSPEGKTENNSGNGEFNIERMMI